MDKVILPILPLLL